MALSLGVLPGETGAGSSEPAVRRRPWGPPAEMPAKPLALVVLASGRGSNFEAILKAIAAGACDAKVLALISDHADAPAISIARKNSIPVHVLEKKDFQNPLAYDEELLALIASHGPDLVILAGWMRILRSPKIFKRYEGRILNIHPSLLPKYPGAHAQKDAYEAHEKVSGLTVHVVDKTLDGGPVLYQEKVDISNCQSADEVAAKILKREHKAFSRVIDDISKGKIKI